VTSGIGAVAAGLGLVAVVVVLVPESVVVTTFSVVVGAATVDDGDDVDGTAAVVSAESSPPLHAATVRTNTEHHDATTNERPRVSDRVSGDRL
jgi:hypothetical protein